MKHFNLPEGISSLPVYLNNAATSWPKPACVSEAVSKALAAQPGAMHRGGLESFDVFDAVRRELAPLLGISDPEQIALGPNATWALNLALFGFPYSASLQSGRPEYFPSKDTLPLIITTKAEHNSVLRPLYILEQKNIARILYLDTDHTGRVSLDCWQKAMNKYHPRLAVFSHASNVTGAVHDAAAMTAAAKSVGAAVLIDASQTLGYLNLEADKWGADMVAFTGHKYLLGPQGTGGLWVRKGLNLFPHLAGGTGIHSDLDTMPEEMPLHLEAGTGNEPSFHGLLAALQWRKEHPGFCSGCEDLLNHLRTGLIRAGAHVIIPEGLCTPVVSFTVPGETVSDIGFILQESYDIICRTGLHCAPKIFSCLGLPETVRLSLSGFTTAEELDTVISAIEDITGIVTEDEFS